MRHHTTFLMGIHLQENNATMRKQKKSLLVMFESRVSVEMMLFLQLFCFGRCTGISFIDSTCIPVCHNKRITRNNAMPFFPHC